MKKMGNRGKKRKTDVMRRPSYMPRHALEAERTQRNGAMGRPRPSVFMQASKLEDWDGESE